MNWTVQEYVAELCRRNKRCQGRNEALEAEMMELFPPDEEELVADPCVVVDSEGTILMWYLPGILCSRRQVWTDWIRPILKLTMFRA